MLFIIIGAVVLLSLIVLLIICSFKLVRQSTAIVIERLGKFHRVLGPGIHFIIPIIDKAVVQVLGDWDEYVGRNGANRAVINLKERVANFPKQSVITKDNAVVDIDTVVFFQVTDPKLFIYGAENPYEAFKALTETTVRNIVGELELDQALTSREFINKKLCYTLDEAADAWGIKIMRVEVQEITPPDEVKDAMHKQMMAERERRKAILIAEGQKRSAILIAEGESEALLLNANAKANAIKLINEANPSAEYLTLEGYKAVKDLADGQATKIVVPSEIQNISGLLASLKAVVAEDTGAKKETPLYTYELEDEKDD